MDVSHLTASIETIRELDLYASIWLFGGGTLAAASGTLFAWHTQKPSRESVLRALGFAFAIFSTLIAIKFALLLVATRADQLGPLMEILLAGILPFLCWISAFAITDFIFGNRILGRSKDVLIIKED